MRCLISPFCTGSVSGCSAKRRAYYEYYTCITIRTRKEDSELQMHWCLHLVLRRRRRHVLVDPRMFSVFLVQRVRLDTCLPRINGIPGSLISRKARGGRHDHRWLMPSDSEGCSIHVASESTDERMIDTFPCLRFSWQGCEGRRPS